jgi:hypothetical protein
MSGIRQQDTGEQEERLVTNAAGFTTEPFTIAWPNTPLELTPLRVEQDRPDFEGRFRLKRFPALSGRRSSAASRWVAAHHSLCLHTAQDSGTIQASDNVRTADHLSGIVQG